jgi:hypothetical protein
VRQRRSGKDESKRKAGRKTRRKAGRHHGGAKFPHFFFFLTCYAIR